MKVSCHLNSTPWKNISIGQCASPTSHVLHTLLADTQILEQLIQIIVSSMGLNAGINQQPTRDPKQMTILCYFIQLIA